jgi:ribonuclease HI
MELVAVTQGLEIAKYLQISTEVVTDSMYVKQGITEWIANWKLKNWKTAAKKPVLNQELWKALDEVVSSIKFPLKWQWVKGHSGHPQNERVDKIARSEANIWLK